MRHMSCLLLRQHLMPRRPRSIIAGEIYHVVNRGNDKRVIFPQTADYEGFVDLLDRGRSRADIDIFGYCLMPTHFHAVLKPRTDAALSAYMHWVCGCYACDLRANTQTIGHGHVFQRRYWSCPVQDERHFISLLRYVEANPKRAGLVQRAEEWAWNSLAARQSNAPRLLSPLPIELPSGWTELVNLKQNDVLLARIRREVCPPL